MLLYKKLLLMTFGTTYVHFASFCTSSYCTVNERAVEKKVTSDITFCTVNVALCGLQIITTNHQPSPTVPCHYLLWEQVIIIHTVTRQQAVYLRNVQTVQTSCETHHGLFPRSTKAGQ